MKVKSAISPKSEAHQLSCPQPGQGSVIQPKLEVGQTDDKYEWEANAVADRVMMMPSYTAAEPPMTTNKASRSLQLASFEHGVVQMNKECEEEKLHMKPESSWLQMAGIDDSNEGINNGQVQTKREIGTSNDKMQIKPVVQRSGNGTLHASSSFAERLQKRSGHGKQLPTKVNHEMSGKMGTDFSGVRIHTDSNAVQMSQDIGAHAFTHGNDVFFNRGKYDPGSSKGKHLLAHELVHVIQQNGSEKIQRKIQVNEPDKIPPHLDSSTMTPEQKKNTPADIVGKTSAAVVEKLLNQLCPDGKWKVKEGLVISEVPTLCSDEGLKLTSTPTSCGCICELTAPDSLDVTIYITDKTLKPGEGGLNESGKISDSGEGQSTTDRSVDLKNRKFHVAVSGLSNEVLGVGDTGVTYDKFGHKKLRDPSWLILGHEMCGHVRRDLAEKKYRDFSHDMTETYDSSAVDIENAIRREHSTQTDNLGIRFGSFNSPGCRHFGLLYEIKIGAKVVDLENKFGIPAEYMNSTFDDGVTTDAFLNCGQQEVNPEAKNKVHAHIFKYKFDQPVVYIMKGCSNFRFSKGEKVYLEGVFAHRVIEADTKRKIAKMWNVSMNKIWVANLHINNDYKKFGVDQQLPIGMNVIIPYDRGAKKVFSKCFS